MPKSVTVISLFLASPSDVTHERAVVSATVDEWNARHSSTSGTTFNLLTWEKSVSAGFGDDGQQVINSQIDDDYDALIAIFWTRLGTATKRDVSGSVEEYHRALYRMQSGEDVEIAFLFKDTPVDFRSVDLTQLAAVTAFEKEAQEAGALTKNFRDDESLRLEISMLLDRLSRKFGEPRQAPLVTSQSNRFSLPATTQQTSPTHASDDDIGLFDIVENLTQYANSGGVFLEEFSRLINQMKIVTEEVTHGFEEIRAVRALDPSEMRPGLNRIADEMNHFSHFVENSMLDYSEDLSGVANSIRDMIRVSYDWLSTEEEMLPALLPFREMLKNLYSVIVFTQNGLGDMAATITNLPRAMTNFNKAKRRLVQNSQAFNNVNENGKVLIEQAISELGALILAVETRDTLSRL
jgi:hypothetical protein